MVYRRDSEHPTSPTVVPACALLRSKGMYVTGRTVPGDTDGGDALGEVGDGHCWCNQTQHALGPDSNLADRESCISGRACYQPGVI